MNSAARHATKTVVGMMSRACCLGLRAMRVTTSQVTGTVARSASAAMESIATDMAIIAAIVAVLAGADHCQPIVS